MITSYKASDYFINQITEAPVRCNLIWRWRLTTLSRTKTKSREVAKCHQRLKQRFVRGVVGIRFLICFSSTSLALIPAFITGLQILWTLRSGELRRNNIGRMFLRLPYILRIMLRSIGRSSQTQTTNVKQSRLSACFALCTPASYG